MHRLPRMLATADGSFVLLGRIVAWIWYRGVTKNCEQRTANKELRTKNCEPGTEHCAPLPRCSPPLPRRGTHLYCFPGSARENVPTSWPHIRAPSRRPSRSPGRGAMPPHGGQIRPGMRRMGPHLDRFRAVRVRGDRFAHTSTYPQAGGVDSCVDIDRFSPGRPSTAAPPTGATAPGPCGRRGPPSSERLPGRQTAAVGRGPGPSAVPASPPAGHAGSPVRASPPRW